MGMIPAPMGHNASDRDALQRAAAWASSHIRDDVVEVRALLAGATPGDVFDLARAMLEIVAALHARMPSEVDQLLGETRVQNMPR
jgi:hypothetical protein